MAERPVIHPGDGEGEDEAGDREADLLGERMAESQAVRIDAEVGTVNEQASIGNQGCRDDQHKNVEVAKGAAVDHGAACGLAANFWLVK